MSLCIFLAEEYPAHKSPRLPDLFFDNTPTSTGSRREAIIQPSNIELNIHGQCPMTQLQSQVTLPLGRSVDTRCIIPDYFLGNIRWLTSFDARWRSGQIGNLPLICQQDQVGVAVNAHLEKTSSCHLWVKLRRSTPHRLTNKAVHFSLGPWLLELAARHRSAAEPFAATQTRVASTTGSGAPPSPPWWQYR
jgi:hypothetical protein